MLYRVEFEIAAVILMFILLVFYYPKKNFPSSSNRLYKCILIVAFVTSILDIASCYTVSFPEKVPLPVNHLVNMLYLSAQNSLPATFFAYILSLTEYQKGRKKKWTLVYAIPYAAVMICILSSPVTKLAYYFDDSMAYKQGPAMIFMYAIACCFLILADIYTFIYRKSLSGRKRLAIYIFVGLSLAAVVAQFLVGNLLLTGFATACSCLVMFMMLQNPEDRVELDTGLFTREAFIMSVNEMIKTSKQFRVIVASPDNIQGINSIFGFNQGSLFIKNVSDFIQKLSETPAYRIESGSIAFFSTREESCEMYSQRIQERFLHPWRLGDNEVVRTCSVCCLSYPDCATTMEEILDTLNYGINEAKKQGRGTVLCISERIPSKERRLIELERQRQFLEEESREANRAKRQAEQADREKSIFLANMSHEIRTPMNAIIGMTDLILRDDINERVRSNANDIKSAGASLLAIINDVLDISKIESGKMEIETVRYDMKAVITDLVNMMSVRISQPAVDFIIRIDKSVPRYMCGDEIRIKQVIINLLNNAAKFTSSGFVQFKVGGIRDNNSYMLEVEVEDTGCGIKQTDLGKLFNTFTRLDTERNKSIEGTGLGLALCKKILVSMGGDIYVQSEYGSGSSFYFAVSQDAVGEETVCQADNAEHMDILLLCQDEVKPEQATAFTRAADVLKELGISAHTAYNSSDVEEILHNNKISHVITTKILYERYSDWLNTYGSLVFILITRENETYEDTPEVRLLHNPIYSLSILRQLELYTDEQAAAKTEEWQCPNSSILIVDDNPVNLRVIAGLLNCYSIICDEAQSGIEAIEKVKAKNYDIVFMDHMMPGMDGVEAMHRIRELGDNYTKLPIVALTANAVLGVRDSFINEGFEDYISKPIDMVKLEQTLLSFLPPELIEKRSAARTEQEEQVIPPELKLTDVDIRKGIDSCGGVTDSYIKLLDTVYKSGLEKLEAMRRYYTDDDLTNYCIEVHGLKSVAASIGYGRLSEEARKQELAAKERDKGYVDTHFGLIDEAYSKLLGEIGKYFDDTREEEMTFSLRGTISGEELEERLEHIGQCIEEYEDVEAREELEKLMQYQLNDKMYKLLKTVYDRVEVFSYDEAAELISMIKEELI